MGFLKRFLSKDDSGNSKNNGKSKNFGYLMKVIDDKQKVLEHDISASRKDTVLRVGGLPLYGSIYINGQGHVIDGAGKIPFFYILRNEYTDFTRVVLENFKFKNGVDRIGYAAIIISRNCTVELVNCHFENIKSEFNAVIHNYGDLKMENCTFTNSCSALMNFNGAEAKLVDCKFSENKSGIGGMVYNMGELYVETSEFHHNSDKKGAGISNYGGTLLVNECEFKGNDSEYGSCIFSKGGTFKSRLHPYYSSTSTEALVSQSTGDNFETFDKDGEVIVINSKFCSNAGQQGIINNQRRSSLIVENSRFTDNWDSIINFGEGLMKGCRFFDNNFTIFDNYAKTTLENCRFFDNNNERVILRNSASLKVINSSFENNTVESVFSNRNDAKLAISEGKIKNNRTSVSSVFNDAKSYASIYKVTFEGNDSKKSDSSNIYNEGSLNLHNPLFREDVRSVLNNGNLEIRKFPRQCFEKIVANNGNAEFFDIEHFLEDAPSAAGKSDGGEFVNYNFSHLDKLIMDNSGEKLVLDNDIVLQNYECDFYEGGIELCRDNLHIDGNNHIIDAAGKSRIFHVTGKNITLENIVFRRGRLSAGMDENYFDGGGAIRTIATSRLTLINCTFEDNSSEYEGGAILNRGDVNSLDSSFRLNNASNCGGAVYNIGTLISNDDSYEENKSGVASAIYNGGVLDISNPSFADNRSHIAQPVFNVNLIRSEIDGDLIYDIGNAGEANDNASISFSSFKSLLRNSDGAVSVDGDVKYKRDEDYWGGISIRISSYKIRDLDAVADMEEIVEYVKGKIKNDELTIEGNGHVLDGDYKSIRFFIDSHFKVTFKDFAFKDCRNYRELFENEGNLILENCRFDNIFLKEHSLIKNGGTVEIKNCIFSNIHSSLNVLENNKEMRISESKFILNASTNLILNEVIISLRDSDFIGNRMNTLLLNGTSGVLSNLNLIYNQDSLGMIRNLGIIDINDSFFNKNESQMAMILNEKKCALKNCRCEYNRAKTFGLIYNIDMLKIDNGTFLSNLSNKCHVLNNINDSKVKNSRFIKNAGTKGTSVIVNNAQLNISNSIFEDNTVKGGSVIFNREGSNLNVSKNTEFREKYPENEIVNIR